MSSPRGGSVVCGCGREYRSQAGLRQHQRRYCELTRREPTLENEGQCSVCNKEFSTRMGMRQHMRLTHPDHYNRCLEMESKTSRKLWTVDEENMLAQAEAEFSGENLLEFLQTISTRSKEAIKLRRKTPSYIEKVQRFRAEFCVKQQQMAELERQQNSPQHQRLQDQFERDDILRLDSKLINMISGIDRKHLDEADRHLRDCILTGAKAEVVPVFEQWSADLVAQFVRRRKTPNEIRQQRSPKDIILEKLADQKLSKNKRRPLEYKLTQMEYQRNKTSYAKHLLDGTFLRHSRVMPDPKDIEETYKNLFGYESPPDDEVIMDMKEMRVDISEPISEEEVKDALKSFKASTPGPDGMSLEDMRKISIEKLLLLLNTILYLERIPSVFRKSRTILIPKTTDELQLTKNWRPITISAILLRLCNKVLAKRLGGINICDDQRGFSRIDGCFANFATVETIIKSRRKNAKPLALVSLDLQKAFDSVSHNSLDRAIRRLNIDTKTRNLIANNYTDLETAIDCEGQRICDCIVRRGVKQGDPMSPVLFNFVLDELLCQLRQTFSGITIGEARTTCLAYADDLVILADTPDDAQRMLNHCYEFFAKRGLRINPSKCRSIVLQTVPGKKKLYVPTEPRLKVDDEYIPIINIGDEFRYLGQSFNTKGISECTGGKLVEQLATVRRAPLKPQQKLDIIKNHLIPRYIAVLQRPNVSRKILQKIDRSIRSTLKKVLHLNIHCSNSIFYAPIRSGGLGIFEFSRMIPLITLSRWNNLKERSTLLYETFQQSDGWIGRYQRMIQGGLDTKEKIQKHQEDELRKSFFGGGIVEVKNHPASNHYLRRAPRYWNGEEFIKAIQLRFNLLPTQGIPSNPPDLRKCRAGCNKVESLSHVLQYCPIAHWWRIQRHDRIVQKLANFVTKKGWLVYIEPRIRGSDQSLKKPDLILVKDNTLIVADVGIHWEGELHLSTQYNNKVNKYSSKPFVEALMSNFPGKTLYILPLIIGARGVWCKQNRYLSDRVQLTRGEIADLITTTMRGGWIIHNQFMRFVFKQNTSTSRSSHRH